MRFFFASSTTFHRQLTDLYDVINPTAAAMWNLRWQVRGYVQEAPEVTDAELHGRFVAGSGIGSANLRRHCVNATWPDQQSELALMSMYAGISLYEGWTASLEAGTEKERLRLQFPSKGTAGRTAAGAGETVAHHSASPSATVESIYGPSLRGSKRNLPGRREDLLLAYRCYKEARNCSAHAGRVANDIGERAYIQAQGQVAGLGARGTSLSLPAMIESQPVAVSLIDVQGLWATMLSLVCTLDAQLAPTTAGEAALAKRWRSTHPFRMLSAGPTRRKNQLLRMNSAAGLPQPADPDALYEFLRDRNLLI